MVDKFCKFAFYGNAFIGLFLRSNNEITLSPVSKPEKFSRIPELLETMDIPMVLADSPLLGLYSVMNDNGILLSKIVEDSEMENLKRKLKENRIDLNVDKIDNNFTAIGNNIVVNNTIALINPAMNDKKAEKKIKDTLDVEVVPFSISGYNTIGSVLFMNNNGFVIHPHVSPEELQNIKNTLGLEGGVATANSGIPFVPLCILANDTSIVFGEKTTGFEQQRILDALGFE